MPASDTEKREPVVNFAGQGRAHDDTLLDVLWFAGIAICFCAAGWMAWRAML